MAMEVAEKREAAKIAQKLATAPKPYTPKKLWTQVWVPMIGNEGQTYVKFPIRTLFKLSLSGEWNAIRC